MRKYIVIVLATISLLLITFMTVNALLKDEKETDSVTFKSGLVKYTIVGSLKSGEGVYVVPGENLIEVPIEFVNESTVDHSLRINFSLKIDNVEVELDDEIIDFSDDDVLGVNGSSFDFNSDFVYDDDDNYYYYLGKEGTILASTTKIVLLSRLYLNGELVQFDYSGVKIEISITIYVRQKDNVDWDTLGSIDYSTGLED